MLGWGQGAPGAAHSCQRCLEPQNRLQLAQGAQPQFCSGSLGELGGWRWGFQTLPLTEREQLSCLYRFLANSTGQRWKVLPPQKHLKALRSTYLLQTPSAALVQVRRLSRAGLQVGGWLWLWHQGPTLDLPHRPCEQPHLATKWVWPFLGLF